MDEIVYNMNDIGGYVVGILLFEYYFPYLFLFYFIEDIATY